MLPVVNMKVDCTVRRSDSQEESVGRILQDVLLEARDEDRLTCGLYESGLLLETNPDCVMACVLPINTSADVTLDIHYTLIEAFCLENDITHIKVDSADKLSRLLTQGGSGLSQGQGHSKSRRRRTTSELDSDALTDPEDSEDEHFMGCGGSDEWPDNTAGGGNDFNCVIIEYPSEKCSEHEAELLEFHKRTAEVVPQPVVTLDV